MGVGVIEKQNNCTHTRDTYYLFMNFPKRVGGPDLQDPPGSAPAFDQSNPSL